MSAESVGVLLTVAGGGFIGGFLITRGLLGVRQITKGARAAASARRT